MPHPVTVQAVSGALRKAGLVNANAKRGPDAHKAFWHGGFLARKCHCPSGGVIVAWRPAIGGRRDGQTVMLTALEAAGYKLTPNRYGTEFVVNTP